MFHILSYTEYLTLYKTIYNCQLFISKKNIPICTVLGPQAADKNKWQKAASKPLVSLVKSGPMVMDGKKPYYVYLIHT